jgi:hypothetical protein
MKKYSAKEVMKLFKPVLDSMLNLLENIFIRFVTSNNWKSFMAKKFKTSSESQKIAVRYWKICTR